MKTKKEILEFLQESEDRYSNYAQFLLENWTSFNSEIFTPKRFAENLIHKAKRYKKQGMPMFANKFREIASQILQSNQTK